MVRDGGFSHYQIQLRLVHEVHTEEFIQNNITKLLVSDTLNLSRASEQRPKVKEALGNSTLFLRVLHTSNLIHPQESPYTPKVNIFFALVEENLTQCIT